MRGDYLQHLSWSSRGIWQQAPPAIAVAGAGSVAGFDAVCFDAFIASPSCISGVVGARL
jgi:hypothetical protein